MVRPSWFDGLTMRECGHLARFSVVRLLPTVAILLFVRTAPLTADELPVSATDRMLVPVRIGSSLLALPEAWIDRGYLTAASIDAVDTLLLAPPIDSFLEADKAAIDRLGYRSIAILLRHDPDGYWRDLYVGRRLALAESRFGVATQDDAARAFDAIPFETLHGGVAAAAGKSASAALYLAGALETAAYGTVAVTARIDGAARSYTISAAMLSRDAPLAVVITLRTTRALVQDDLALIDATFDTVNSRFDLQVE